MENTRRGFTPLETQKDGDPEFNGKIRDSRLFPPLDGTPPRRWQHWRQGRFLTGFTLIEVTIAAAISTIILFGTFAILQASNKQLDTIHAKMSLEESPREALFKMAQEIRQTAWHKIEDTFGATDGNGVEHASTLSFLVPVPSPDEESLVDSHYSPKWASTIEYSLDGNTQQILRTSTDETTGETLQAILANNVTALEFSRKSATPELITIIVDAQKELADGRMIPEEPLQMTAQAEARNP